MDDRKMKILAAVVDEYIRTGEPVGSKAIMSYINASSATIRNEMAELEKQGYLEQPHTSAGRVPTYSGYRLYVDRLLETEPLSPEEKDYLSRMLPENEYSEERLVKSASAALARLTSCATFVSSENPRFSVISKVEVIPTGKRLYVLLMITSTGKIKNRTCRLELDLTNEQLEYFTRFVKENLEGVPLDDMSDEMMEKLQTALGTYLIVMSPLVHGLIDMTREITKRDIDISGTKNLIDCKEIDRHELMTFFDNNESLMRLMDDSFSGLHVMFAEEHDKFLIGNTSLVSSDFSKDGHIAGHLGVIGPMRIDYKKVIPYVEFFTERITEILSSEGLDEDEIQDCGVQNDQYD